MSRWLKASGRYGRGLAANPGLLTPKESLARALVLGAFWTTFVAPAMFLLNAGVPPLVLAIAFVYAWLQGGIAWRVYRESRRARGVSMALLRPKA